MENTNTKEKRHRHTPITMNKWFGMLLLLTIPLVNIYYIIYWAFIQRVSQTRRNYARAVILWFIIVALIIVLATIIFQPNIKQHKGIKFPKEIPQEDSQVNPLAYAPYQPILR